ncbi:hypothetical protein HPB50_004415 [Hyalomma asiaticum]|uniref:Uncharacterized protein n=1 Tax=Hyalomma asiaticum TaxID=266040 RepID=A0ACB7TC48_HYAAI|nr:hypothetical protein HPB50_004415 [Hyalomma asiaticum]
MPGPARARLLPRASRSAPMRIGCTWRSRPAQHHLCRAEMLLNTAAVRQLSTQRSSASPATPPAQLGCGSQELAAHVRASNTAEYGSTRSAALDPASTPNTGTWDLGTSATLDLARLCGPPYLVTHQVPPGRTSSSSRSPGLHCAWPEFRERTSCHRALLSRFPVLGGSVRTFP